MKLTTYTMKSRKLLTYKQKISSVSFSYLYCEGHELYFFDTSHIWQKYHTRITSVIPEIYNIIRNFTIIIDINFSFYLS
jgi:hypothetical protein